MVRVPDSWLRAGLAGLAGANYAAGSSSRRILTTPDHLYTRPVSVDLGNDGVAPQVTFKANGTAQAVAGPSGGGDSWSLDQCYISTSVGQLDAALCTVYVGPLPIAQYAVTGSLAGGGSQFGMGGLGLGFGWFVYAVWSGGTSGAFGYLRVTGVKSVLTNLRFCSLFATARLVTNRPVDNVALTGASPLARRTSPEGCSVAVCAAPSITGLGELCLARRLRSCMRGLASHLQNWYDFGVGNVRQLPKSTPSGLVDLHVLVRRDLLVRIETASQAIDQTRSVWLRMAILEKLDRDASS